MVRAGLDYLAAADPGQLPAATQAECLRELEQDAAGLTAARAGFLAAFTGGQGHAGDGDYSAVSWLIHRTGITRGAAVGHSAWAKRTWVHISLADLLLLDGDSALQQEWTERVRARWAARRAQASETGASDGAWLDGDAAAAIACDAAMAPIVTGDVDVDALEDMVRLCVELDARRRDGTRDAAWAAIEQQVIGKAVDLLSGLGGLVSFLRRRQLG